MQCREPQSTGTSKEDIEQLTADAAAAVATMRHQPEIDTSRIALIGQNHGSVIDTEEAWTVHKLRWASDPKVLQVPVRTVFGDKDPLVVASHGSRPRALRWPITRVLESHCWTASATGSGKELLPASKWKFRGWTRISGRPA